MLIFINKEIQFYNFVEGKISAITVVIMAAMAGNLDRLNHWVQVATVKILWALRASTWGNPRFWPEKESKYRNKISRLRWPKCLPEKDGSSDRNELFLSFSFSSQAFASSFEITIQSISK